MKAKSYGRIIGILFICQFFSSVLYHQFLVGNFVFSEESLSLNASKRISILSGVLLHIITDAGGILAGLLLFQLFKKLNLIIIAWYLIFTLIGFTINLMNGVDVLALSEISLNVEIFKNSGPAIQQHYYWTHMISMLLPLLSFPPLFYLFLRHHLLPRWIAGLGLIGSILMPMTVISGILGYGESMFLMLPLGIAQLSMSIYLIIYNFKDLSNEYLSK